MWSLLALVLIAHASGCARGAGFPTVPAAEHYAFVNGRWFDGEGFQPATWYSTEGRLTRKLPSGPIQTVDLAGLYIVPPFGEAHNHNVEGRWNMQAVVQRYLQDGVFYVKNPNDVRDFALQIRQSLNVPTSIDATFAHAGLTGRGGHPVALYEDVLRVGRYEPAVGPLERGWFENRAYVVVETEAEIEAKWPLVMSGRPDFLKVYLVHSEDDGRSAGGRPGHHRQGLHPALVPGIVARAHAAGLRVTAHVETAADFRQAVRAGVDELAHVPGWLIQGVDDAERARLTEDDARFAAERKVRVVTTSVAGSAMPSIGGHHPHGQHEGPASEPSDHHQPAPAESEGQVLKDNLRLLHRAGAAVVIGSDHADTSLAEVLHLRTFHLFDNLTLLKMWCEATPAAIFPERKIGRFAEGYEASFLALAGNPIEDFTQVQAIRRRFKQGVPLDHFVGPDAASLGTGQSSH
ncbi:MAG: amidohydrolase family protein [Nitrospira sp.]|nr:amidohydrolase family protein [Nitrospira sp.]